MNEDQVTPRPVAESDKQHSPGCSEWNERNPGYAPTAFTSLKGTNILLSNIRKLWLEYRPIRADLAKTLMFKLLPILTILSALLTGGSLVLSTEGKELQDDFSVSLSKAQVFIPCICDGIPFGSSRSNKETPEDSLRVRVKITSNRPDQNRLSYKYQVTAGKIIGQGAEIDWDFSNTAPGKYSIKINVYNASGDLIAATTKDIDLDALNCHCPCDCPIISIFSPIVSAPRNQPIEFRVRVTGGPDYKPTIAWNVTGGTISSGQGTRSIQVSPDPQSKDKFIRAEVVVSEPDPLCGCDKRSSISIPITDQDSIANTPPVIEDLILDETTLVHPCPPGVRPSEGEKVSLDSIIHVATRAGDRDNDVLVYDYKASGGKIDGWGPYVKWDLTGVPPGTYRISVGVDDGRGTFESTRENEISVGECLGCGLVDCPTIGLKHGRNADMPDEFVVTANISGGNVTNYTWTTSEGEIIEGQGTPSATIKAPENFSEMTVTVEVNNVDDMARAAGCLNSESIVIRRDTNRWP